MGPHRGRRPAPEGRGARLRLRLLLGLAVLFEAGCGTAKVYRSHLGVATSRVGSLAASRIPGPLTAAVLERREIATPLGLVGPRRAADSLERCEPTGGDAEDLLALAELRAKEARRAELYAPRTAPGLYLDAVEAATRSLAALPHSDRDGPIPGPLEQKGRRVYNLAVEGFLRASAGPRMRLDSEWRERLAESGIRVVTNPAAEGWRPDYFDHFFFAGDYRVLGLIDHKQAEGLGVPLIAEREGAPLGDEEPTGEEKFYPRRLQVYPATALLRVGPDGGEAGRVVTLELHDPMRVGQVGFDGGPRPLANDLTTPLSFYFTSLPLPRLTQVGLLRPGVLEKQAGLYLLHPYERGKIPVLLIHGLWSSPDTWQQALNELRGDPELRERYQFWVYFYPTGDPFLYSAMGLRKSLADARRTLDPGRTDPAFDRMVLVGHSMGGLLSRLMVVDSGTAFWDEIANRPFTELDAGPLERGLVGNTFFFAADPSVRRVVFVATPHRGSSLSGQLVGRLGNALIRLPGRFEAAQRDLLARNDGDFFKGNRLKLPMTSITQLSPRSAALSALNLRPFAPGVPYHSIIARAAPVPPESSTDLVVPYTSSHLDGAASELLVDGTHACLGKPEVIEEIRRILFVHLQESGPPSAWGPLPSPQDSATGPRAAPAPAAP